jgi:hypothetical protein
LFGTWAWGFLILKSYSLVFSSWNAFLSFENLSNGGEKPEHTREDQKSSKGSNVHPPPPPPPHSPSPGQPFFSHEPEEFFIDRDGRGKRVTKQNKTKKGRGDRHGTMLLSSQVPCKKEEG